jgi:arylsulfatase A-like enzyme
LLILFALCLGCGAKKPNIVIVLIDTLRADEVGAYGCPRRVTPNLDALAQKSVVFKNAQAPASWTVPSVTSLFTGVYPWSHGVIYAEVGNGNIKSQQKLSEKFVTLAETLHRTGYTTFCISANYHLHPQYGLAQGFDYDKVFLFTDREPVDRQFALWLPEMQRLQQRGAPYFLYVHYFDPHAPYKYHDDFTPLVNPRITPKEAADWGSVDYNNSIHNGIYYDQPDKMGLIRDLYDGEVMAADDSLGKLLKGLPDLDDSLVIVIADHGEAFGDHHNLSHGLDLYSETLRVPLVVKLPKNAHAGSFIDTPVSLIDLYPTLAALAGAVLPKYLEGADIAPLWLGGKTAQRMLFGMTQRDAAHIWYAAVGPRFKLLFHDSANRYELYDMRLDLREQNNVIKTNMDLARDYRRILSGERRRNPLFNPGVVGAPMSDELRSTLHQLGYL